MHAHTRSLGEICSGPVTDIMMQSARKRAIKNGGVAPAEVRLQGIWTGAITVPIGLLMSVSIASSLHYSDHEPLPRCP